MANQNILFIERFGIGVSLDEVFSPNESETINLICQSESYENGLKLIQENKGVFSFVSIKAQAL